MGDMRFLVRAVVVGVNDTNVVYPCCIQCYSKMLHNIRINVWQCIRCNIITTASQVMWRYRLSLSIADSSASCHVSLFGGTLIPYFGCSANEFHRFVLSACIQEDKIQQALDLTLRGKSYLFGLKIAMSPTAKQPKQETICRPVCLANLLNSHHTSNFHDGKRTGFIATQMIHVPLESQSSACLTIITMLKNLISCSLISSPKHVASHSAESSAVSPNQKESHKSQNSSSSSDKISHCEVEPSWGCKDRHPHSPMEMKHKPLTEMASSLSCRSADLGWFTCDSSMERAFPSQGDACLPRSCQTEGITYIGANPSTSLEKSFGILHATCSVGPDRVKCSKQTSHTTRKPLRNTTVYTRFQGRNQIYSQASASERQDMGASDHDGQKTAADGFSHDTSLTGLEPQHFSTRVCDDRMGADSWFCEDGAESLSPSLNDSESLLVEETSCQNAPDVGKSVLDNGKSVSSVGKSESAPQKKSTTLAPWAVKLIKGRNSTAAVNCGSLREAEKDNILSVPNQKEEIEKIKNNLKSASHLDHNSSNLLEHLDSGQDEEDDSRHQSRIPSYHICSLDVDLAMPDSEDLSLFLNAAAIEMADSKPCPIIKASKPKYQEHSQLECWQQRHLIGNKRTSWSEESASCLNSQLVLQESVEVCKPSRRSHHTGFCQKIGFITSEKGSTDEIIAFENPPVIPEKPLRLCDSGTPTPPNIGIFHSLKSRKSTEKYLSENILATEEKTRPVNISLTSPSIIRKEEDVGNSVVKTLRLHCGKEDKNLHCCALSSPQMTKGILKCDRDNVDLEGSSHNSLLFGLEEDVLTSKSLQEISSRPRRPVSATKVPKQRSYIKVLENVSTSDIQGCFSPSKTETFHSQNLSPISEILEARSEQWLLSQNWGDNSHLCLAVTEPWYSTDPVQVTENKQSENDLNGAQGSREQLMQSNRRENSSNNMAGVWGPSQPLTLSRRKQPYRTKRNAGSTCTVSGEAQSGCESPHSFPQSVLPSIQGSVDSVPSHVQSDLTHSHDASADLFGSQSQTNASKGDSDEMSCQRPDKQVDVSDFKAHLDNFGNNAAKDLLLYRKCLLSTPTLLHALHSPEWSSASMAALSQGSKTFCETEMEIPECSSKKRVRFSNRPSRISTIPSIDFLMAKYPSPINREPESTPTAIPIRSCLKGAVLNPRDRCNSPQMATPDINKPTTPLDASTPMSTRRHWLSSPLDKMQNSGSQELYSPSESGNKTCISVPDKNAKTLLHHHTHSSESCKCSSDCTTLKWQQKETIDRRCLFHIPNVQAGNASRKWCSKGSEDSGPVPFCKTTNQKVCRHSIHDVIKMSQDCLWQGQTANTEKHSVTFSNMGILFCNALKQGNAANTEMVPAQQASCFCDGSLVLFDESDLDSDGISQPFSKQTKIMTQRHTHTSRNTNRGHEMPSPRQRVMKVAYSDCSPSLFSQ